ncbi:MAG TPA: dihydroorotate dehydrogenase electron transfer subunit [Desulfobacterales bacterium]|nr:dihydroorotate dehydrogenase electron transfer subunit [Desulfobacterales bacterium]
MIQVKRQIILNESLGADIYRLSIQAPEIAAAAQAGQFIMVKAGMGFDPLLRRPFSIHQVEGDEIRILFKRLGKGTALLSKLNAGERLDILGPLGNAFTLKQPPCCLIGGGMGVAPLLFLAQTMLSRGITPHILLGARNKEELMAFLPAFQALGCPLQYATDDGSMGQRGFIIEALPPLLAKDNKVKWQVYSCGPYPMMRAVAAICHSKWPCQVSMETMMACGISACLGCTVTARNTNEKGGQYLHVCQDGPVFAADRIEWKS